MEEKQRFKWEIRLGLLASTLTAVGLVIGIWKFTEEQKQNTRLQYELLARQNTVDFQRQIWVKQLETYQRIARISGALTTAAEDPKEFHRLANEFLSMYWGVSIPIEDKTVEEKMIALFLEIRDFQNGWSNEERLKIRASELTKACRQSSDEAWKKIMEGNATS